MDYTGINHATAKAYIRDYITNGPDNDTDDWDMEEAGDMLVDYVRGHDLDSFDDVPADDFTDILRATQNA